MNAIIREAVESDWPAVWALFQAVTAAGDSFAYDETTAESTARKLWFESPTTCFVAEEDSCFAGTYYVRPNQPGRGDHIANAGYMVHPAFRGRGLAVEMCRHSLGTARRLGFTAMQFNFVVASNTAAVKAWEKEGFAILGRLPRAFRHRDLGWVDALIMHRDL